MTSTTVSPAPGPALGATALGSASRPAVLPGDVFRALRVLASTAFEVAVLGRYDEEAAGVVRRSLPRHLRESRHRPG
ncbi:hypothetical protein I3F58_03695 [Streptomyces sp. MUM 203J]|uniref:hypothetical protein n=1 Tax=Streptomyces sp. MUM 203J TaxID=2791990 RepID=UPI001F0476AB|nr:hypothetical protein [Streptomyces sp. MUM 203J]MCH0538677.1 hypothetical protein [Streptomyces sp. MUM 203J]